MQLLDPKLGEITQTAVVDTKHWNVPIAYHSRCGDHRPVASEHKHQIDVASQRAILLSFNRAARFVLDLLAFDLWTADQNDAALAEPFHQPAKGVQRIGLMRLDDDADAFDRSHRCSVVLINHKDTKTTKDKTTMQVVGINQQADVFQRVSLGKRAGIAAWPIPAWCLCAFVVKRPEVCTKRETLHYHQRHEAEIRLRCEPPDQVHGPSDSLLQSHERAVRDREL